MNLEISFSMQKKLNPDISTGNTPTFPLSIISEKPRSASQAQTPTSNGFLSLFLLRTSPILLKFSSPSFNSSKPEQPKKGKLKFLLPNSESPPGKLQRNKGALRDL
ncbi:hypothetical protein FRX31_031484 [Thalictrum thalictroides]|uniref:Uncharacterized protein n=1 Tax=Thalictrum thalictroides TaxID=46969 RepID=A0A7J6V1Q9_THATH|nr:hypothetical protein FRX31_031484 [Thalictrum thalictroides]